VPLDQLYYTWAPHGVEGVNQFQVAAISSGLRSGATATAMPMIRRLCAYDPPRDTEQLPVSFGWLDHEGSRIAFHRVGLPLEVSSRGNFAGHFLVGPAEDLPEASIAGLFGAPFWWKGFDSESPEFQVDFEGDFELPQLRLDELPIADPPDEASVRAGQALLYRIFSHVPDARIAVTASADALGTAIRAAAQLAPEALGGLSFSTYEGEPIFPFDVVGGAGAGSSAIPQSLELPKDLDDLSALTLDALGGPGRLSGAAARVAAPYRAASPPKIWDAARQIVGTVREGAGAETLGMLAEPAVVRFACESGEGLDTVITVVQSGAHGVAATLKDACSEMDPAVVEKLGSAVEERYRSTREPAGCGAFAAALGAAADAALDVVLERVLKDEREGASLRGEDAAAILARAAERGFDAASARPLLRALHREALSCAKAPPVPSEYLAVMFELGLSDSDAGRLVEVIRARPAVLSLVQLDGSENKRCLPVLQQLADSVGPVAAGQCIAALPPRRDSAGLPPTMSRVCDEIASRLLLEHEQSLAIQVLERSGSSDATNALGVFWDGSARSRQILDVAAHGSHGIRLPYLRQAVIGIALVRAVAAITAAADVASVWRALEGRHSGDDEMERLHRLLALAEEYGTEATVAEVLAWVAIVKAPTNPKLVSRLGRIRNGEVDELSLRLAPRTSETALSSQDELVKQSNRRTRRWWKRLHKQQRKRS
jgi:hypothetical protein